jgi:hypothetical protein
MLMGFYHSPEKRWYDDNELIVLRPRVPVQRCELVVFLLRDYSRVFVGGGQWGFDSLAREADAVEIEALAERFGWPELRRVLDWRRTVNTAEVLRNQPNAVDRGD